jgi:ABC-type cobalamin/Fe3+-siderophores transport system ATPase subunit
VNNRGKIRYVFVSSHTSQGFYTFIPELVNGVGKVYILKGAPGSGKSTFIRLLGEVMSQQGYDVEFWVSALDPVTPDGVYIAHFNTAIINGSLPQPIDPKYPGVREIIINLGEYWDQAIIEQRQTQIIEQVDQTDKFHSQVVEILKEASRVKAEIRKANAAHLNMEKIEQLIRRLSLEIMENRPGEKHYFAGVITGDGLVDYINELSADCKKRYIFKGPSGSGKSTVINELAREAKQKGYFLEYYHCGLEVEYLVMVVIRNLQLALIEVGHAEVALKTGDIVVDMTMYIDSCDSDQIAVQSSEAYRRLEALLLQAQQELENSYQANREIKKIFASAMDFERLDNKRQKIAEEILNSESVSQRFRQKESGDGSATHP